jgi:hypothetical protein
VIFLLKADEIIVVCFLERIERYVREPDRPVVDDCLMKPCDFGLGDFDSGRSRLR